MMPFFGREIAFKRGGSAGAFLYDTFWL